MAYRPLPYHQYFIDNSEDRNHLGTARRKVHYRAVTYACHGLDGLVCQRCGVLVYSANFQSLSLRPSATSLTEGGKGAVTFLTR